MNIADQEAERELFRLGTKDCTCHRCIKEKDLWLNGTPLSAAMMIVCPVCRNKRCPKASDHALMCTHSNEPGQKGSVYEGVK